MPSRIEDYALIGDCYTAALVSREGSIDWLCLPRFDSSACFSALLGTPDHGRWLLTPMGEVRSIRRRYREGTLVLETDYETEDGSVTVTDCMPVRAKVPDLVHRLVLVTPIPLKREGFNVVAEFVVVAGQRESFTLIWHPSHEEMPAPIDPWWAIVGTEKWWLEWSNRCTYRGEWREAVLRSLITLKALTYAPTGGIVAAPTTSLPEHLGGVRNWDYRFCWLRDATFTLFSLLKTGYLEEAHAWRAWLLRAIAGRPAETQILYGIGGERRLTELELTWLPGYEGSQPVRIGNAAAQQFQLDVYGEVIDALYHARVLGLEPLADAWASCRTLLEFVESAWTRPDEGIWEVRGPRRHFTHSKVMAWVAIDRGVKAMERFKLEGPLERWKELRETIHAQVCSEGFNAHMSSFVQSYGSTDLDASLLMIPLVGFLPAKDPRVLGTVAAIEKGLMSDGFVARYIPKESVDGLPVGEGAFLPCTFWLADNLHLMGREAEARALFEKLLGLCNDVGLISEEYDVRTGRLVGNFPQAFTHVGLVNTAMNLSPGPGPADTRPKS
ncbi:MAG: glycoside hydrolase family 15 protein [Planctomycetes bacterium]|nr:glycoside hydrolase family 15 protein [Planctomycetota bacterium]